MSDMGRLTRCELVKTPTGDLELTVLYDGIVELRESYSSAVAARTRAGDIRAGLVRRGWRSHAMARVTGADEHEG
jgi:hypothetical protein